MDLSTRMLADELSSRLQEAYISHLELCKYPQVALKNQKLFSARRIYIAEADHLSPEPEFEGPVIVIATKRPPKAYFVAQCSILVCKGNLEDIFSDVMAAQLRLDDFGNKLQNDLLDGKDIQHFLDTCSNALEATMVLLDSQMSLLAMKRYQDEEDEELDYLQTHHYFSAHVINQVKNSKEFEKLMEYREPKVYNLPNEENGCVFENYFYEDMFLGRLIIFKRGDKVFPSGILEFMKQIGVYFRHLLLQKMSFAPKVYDYFLPEILNGRLKDRSLIEFNLSHMNWRIQDTYVVLFVLMGEVEIRSRTCQYIIDLLRGIYKDSRIFLFNQNIIGVIRTHAISQEQLAADITPILRDADLRAGMSQMFDDFTELLSYYRQAEAAVRIGVKLDNTQRLYHHQKYALQHLLQEIVQAGSPGAHFHPVVKSLFDFDRREGTELAGTLRVFLEQERASNQTAQILGIHRNTLQHRLEKMMQVAHFDMESSVERIRILLTYQLMDAMKQDM
jgi:PucR family transcriptional regulator, proline-responsive transcriptional activator